MLSSDAECLEVQRTPGYRATIFQKLSQAETSPQAPLSHHRLPSSLIDLPPDPLGVMTRQKLRHWQSR